MKPVIKETRIRYWVHFAPDPKNRSFPTASRFVDSGLVRDIAEYPPDVNYLTIGQVAEVEFETRVSVGWMSAPATEVMRTKSFNEELFHVVHSEERAEKMRSNRHFEIEVHPSLKGKLWVFGDERQALEQELLQAA